MEYQEINFADLREQYCDRGRAAWAMTTLRTARAGTKRPNLARLLRHHEEGPISARETYQRDSFDFLLAFYSLLEIASLIRYIPDTFPEGFRDEAIWNLSNKSTVRYYEEHYPILLPRLFRLRLESDRRLYEKVEDEAAHSLFQRFLGMQNRVEADEEIDLFQWFLDDGSKDNYCIDDTLILLSSPEGTIKALMADPKERTVVQRSVSGAQKFLIFCSEFDNLLQEAFHFPLFQSAMWSYYSYWFELIREKVNSRIRGIITSFQEWAPEQSETTLEEERLRIEKEVASFWNHLKPGTSPKEVEERFSHLNDIVSSGEVTPDKKQIRQYATVINGVLDRLFLGTYGRALRQATYSDGLVDIKERPNGAGESQSELERDHWQVEAEIIPGESKKTCFVIGPMGKGHLERLKWLAREVIQPLLGDSYAVSTPDLSMLGNIIHYVIRSCDRADLVVADTTGDNPNVLYEMAILDAMGRACIPVKFKIDEKVDAVLFDRAAYRYFELEEEASTAQATLKPVIEQVQKQRESGDLFSNPITDYFGDPLNSLASARGLARGYFRNFVIPCLKGTVIGGPNSALGKVGLKVQTLLPNRLSQATRGSVEKVFGQGRIKNIVVAASGRVITTHIWADHRGSEGNPIIVDIPTVITALLDNVHARLGKGTVNNPSSLDFRTLEDDEIGQFVHYLQAFFKKGIRDGLIDDNDDNYQIVKVAASFEPNLLD